MQDLIIKFFEGVSFPQAILIITISVILYYKIKNTFNQKTEEVKKEINGLGQRFDAQFGEYKNKQLIESKPH